MPPKKDPESAGSDSIKALCALMASSTDFAPDYNVVATALGVSHAKNVPRKIDTIINPHGYALKNKKIVELNDDGESKAPATPKKKTPATPAASDSEAKPKKAKTPRTPKTPKASPTKKTPVAKKRKVEVEESEAEVEVEEEMGDEVADSTEEKEAI